MRFTAADLLAGAQGRAYHLNIAATLLAPNVIICGDPERVPVVAANFLHDCCEPVHHRGLTTITGLSEHEQRVTVTTSGMGTPSLEIITRELSALQRVDLVGHELRPATHANWTVGVDAAPEVQAMPPPFSIIRLGTSGSLQRDIPIGAAIITDWAVGLDNAGLFYDIPAPAGAEALEASVGQAVNDAIPAGHRFKGAIRPYAARASRTVVERLQRSAVALGYQHAVGTTVTAPGLFAAQGRPVEGVTNTVPDLDQVLANLVPPTGQRLTNFEMEAAMLLHLGAHFGWQVGAICVAIANRRDDSANTTDYNQAVMRAAKIAIDSFALSQQS